MNCRGLTLIELMIGMLLTLMVLGGAISVFVGSKETFRLEEDISEMQENFRFIANRFHEDFSMVGFTGCSSPFQNNTPAVNSVVTGLVSSEVIQGVEGGAGGSDSITITYANPQAGIPIVDAGAFPTSPIYVSQNLPLFQALVDNFSGGGSPVPVTLMVGDCDGADIFLVTAATTTTAPNLGVTVGSIEHAAAVPIGGLVNNDDRLSVVYGRPGEQIATVYSRSDVTYEIDTVGGETGLYETRDGGGQQLVLGGVTDMEIQYGIDVTGDGIADSYEDWSVALVISQIASLKIELTMVVSVENGVDVTRDYLFTVKLRDMGL